MILALLTLVVPRRRVTIHLVLLPCNTRLDSPPMEDVAARLEAERTAAIY
jgi:hypothetical protein